jgi:hypothetical protein
MNYYYLVASLPSLSMDERPSISRDRFLAVCSERLSRADMAEVAALLNDPLSAAGGFAATWQAWEFQLRNIIAEIRAERDKSDATPFLRHTPSFDAALQHETLNAFSHHSPLDREHALDRLRWKKAESLAGFNPFSSNAVKSYALRLALTERWAAFDRDTGAARVDMLVSRPERDAVGAPTEPEPAMT